MFRHGSSSSLAVERCGCKLVNILSLLFPQMAMTVSDSKGDWHPVLQISSDAWLGFKGQDRSSLWIGDFRQERREVQPANPTGLLSLLERPYSVILAEIEFAESNAAPNSLSILSRLIPHAVVAAALRSKSDYWVSLALAWLDDVGATESLRNQVASIEGARWASQSTRHAARRLRRTWSSASDHDRETQWLGSWDRGLGRSRKLRRVGSDSDDVPDCTTPRSA